MSIKERLKGVDKKKKICFRKFNEKLRKISSVYVKFRGFKVSLLSIAGSHDLRHFQINCQLIIPEYSIIIVSENRKNVEKEKNNYILRGRLWHN